MKNLDAMTPAELRAVFLSDEAPEKALEPRWAEVREAAFRRYWSVRVPHSFTNDQVRELLEHVNNATLGSATSGIVGEAAQGDRLTSEQVRTALGVSLNDFASRALRARNLIQQSRGDWESLLDGLLSIRGIAWALEQLVRYGDRRGVELVEARLSDKGLYRLERHALREAVKQRLSELKATERSPGPIATTQTYEIPSTSDVSTTTAEPGRSWPRPLEVSLPEIGT